MVCRVEFPKGVIEVGKKGYDVLYKRARDGRPLIIRRRETFPRPGERVPMPPLVVVKVRRDPRSRLVVAECEVAECEVAANVGE